MEKRATQILEEEHHLIQKVVGAIAAMADRVYEGQVVEKKTLVNIVDFMRIFVEKCHHEKEDVHLFPLLVTKGVPVVGCPIGVLSHEHQTSRKLTADLGGAVESYMKDPSGMGRFLVPALRSVVALYPGHIWKENYLLFPMADKLLSDQEQQGLVEEFEAIEKHIGPIVHHRFEQMAEELVGEAQET